jgi:GT2 family glycosyltransferase
VSPPSFDLVVATVDRVEPLDRLLTSLAEQGPLQCRVIVVDQNEDDRLAATLDAHASLTMLRLRAPRGLSRARNAALATLDADVVAFPDDDCEYPPHLLERISTAIDGVDGVSGRTADATGGSLGRWSRSPGLVDERTVWNRVNSAALFLRTDVVARVGAFDERLGLGTAEPWASGEEVDYLLRAIRAGAAIRYDPDLVVRHPQPVRGADELARIGRRDGASVGYLLRKHRLGTRAVARALVRPLGGIAASGLRRDQAQARFHAATLRGRAEGYVRARS